MLKRTFSTAFAANKHSYKPKRAASVVFSDNSVIVVLGDLSDVDTFLALEFYAKHGFTIIFVNNLPAYVNVDSDTNR